jgi:hypothetical protein
MLKNELLQRAQAEVEKNVADRASYDKIVKAGLQAIYDKAMFQKLTKGLRESQNPAEDIAKGMAGILTLLSKKARGTMPATAMVQAGAALLLDALDFAEQAGVLKVDNTVLDTAVTEYMEAVLPVVGLSSQKMQQVLQDVQATADNPERMAAYQAHMAKNGGK